MILKRIKIASDLGEASIEAATYEGVYGPPEERTLFVSTRQIDEGEQLARKLKISYMVDDSLSQDAWYIKNKYFGVFSPGA